MLPDFITPKCVFRKLTEMAIRKSFTLERGPMKRKSVSTYARFVKNKKHSSMLDYSQ